jgi:protocatechuate 3,4-dioxygenase beta subunit
MAPASFRCRGEHALTRHLTRRHFLNAWLAGPMVLAGIGTGQAQPLDATPACDSGDAPTPPQTAGPFYTPGTPRKQNFRGDGNGRPVTLFGFVVDRNCRPQAGVTVDFWHADDAGTYDNRGYRFRGHQVSDADGRYMFETILPGEYPGRTRHYHALVASSGGTRLVTQLYFPGDPGNARDFLFDSRLLVELTNAADGALARFDFVIDA